jgi:uncharacterized membrane protein YcaP (DUF421 family)
METITFLFGPDNDAHLTVLHMCLRALVISAYCLLLLRISGRRAMALGTPIDNVYAILLGAVLSRVVTGASPFFPTVGAAATITFFHLAISYLCMKSRLAGSVVKGEAMIVYRDGNFDEKNMKYCRISVHDLMAGVRQSSGLDSLDEVKTIYVERNGRISVIKKGAE